MKKYLIIILLLLPFSVFSQVKDLMDGYDLFTYGEWITGLFSSEVQSSEDSYFDDVYVYTKRFRSDRYGEWFYTEQGERRTGLPYRVRIYLLKVENDSTFVNTTFKLKNENELLMGMGVDELEKLLDGIYFDDLNEMVGCNTYIYKDSRYGYYYGETNGSDCKGSFRGATYTTSKFRVYPHMIVSWERGWNDNGVQIWGSSNGYYYYRRIK